METLSVKLQCRICGREFNFSPENYDIRGLKNIPKKCPACLDRYRPSIVESRKTLDRWEKVKVMSSFDFKRVERRGDKAFFKLFIYGKQLGSGGGWSGRIDGFSSTYIRPGDIINLEKVEVVHRLKQTNDFFFRRDEKSNKGHNRIYK